MTRPHHKSCERWNKPGQAHALTFSCFRRQPFLARDRTRRWLSDAINLARDRHGFDLWGYVIMPEHVHLLVFPRHADHDISEFLATVKISVTRRALHHVRKHAPNFLARMADRSTDGRVVHRFWQRGGGYDRNLLTPALIWRQINYLHANPVRRKLCARPIDWPWSSAREYAGLPHDGLTIDRATLPVTDAGSCSGGHMPTLREGMAPEASANLYS